MKEDREGVLACNLIIYIYNLFIISISFWFFGFGVFPIWAKNCWFLLRIKGQRRRPFWGEIIGRSGITCRIVIGEALCNFFFFFTLVNSKCDQ